MSHNSTFFSLNNNMFAVLILSNDNLQFNMDTMMMFSGILSMDKLTGSCLHFMSQSKFANNITLTCMLTSFLLISNRLKGKLSMGEVNFNNTETNSDYKGN